MMKTALPVVHLLLPHKERFTDQNAGAVSTVVYELAQDSYAKSKQNITIFGSQIDNPKTNIHYQGLQAKHHFWQSRNKAMGRAYLNEPRNADIIEVHGRPQIALQIAKARPESQVILYLHNDPRTMKGAREPSERITLAKHLSAIVSITDYVQNCFLDGLDEATAYRAIYFVNHLGVNRTLNKPMPKKKRVFMAGRMVEEKGFLEACKGALPVLLSHPEWEICIAGGKHFTSSTRSAYENELAELLAPLGNRATLLGHQPLSIVQQWQQTSEICIVPSRWQEPGGLTVLEALAAGTALITTKKGGIPEFANGRAKIVTSPDPLLFADAIACLIENETARKELQQRAWDDFPFTAQAMSQRMTDFRLSLLS